MLRLLVRTSALMIAWMAPATAQETISISSEWGSVTAELADNTATRALVRMLPVTLQMRDHLRQEKTGSLPAPLPETGVSPSGVWSNHSFDFVFEVQCVGNDLGAVLGFQRRLATRSNEDKLAPATRRLVRHGCGLAAGREPRLPYLLAGGDVVSPDRLLDRGGDENQPAACGDRPA
jgi:hypothetical protein